MSNEKIDSVVIAVSRLDDALGGLRGLMELLSAADSAQVGANGIRAVLCPMVGEIQEARQELRMLL